MVSLTRGRVWQLAVETVRCSRRDRILGLGAEAGFWQLLSTPSLALGVLGLIGFFGGLLGPDTVAAVQRSVLHGADRLIVPSAVSSTIAPALNEILRGGRADVVSSSFIVSMWTGSSAMACYVNTITIAYGMRHLRGTIRSRALALALYFAFLVANVILLPLAVIGPARLVSIFPGHLQHSVRIVVDISYWPVLIAVGIGLLMSLYHLALPVRIPWRRALPGAVLALFLWLAGSLVLRTYLDWSIHRGSTYGTLASPVAVLLFLYLLAVAVLLGAELNAQIDRVWPLAQTERARERERDTALSWDRNTAAPVEP